MKLPKVSIIILNFNGLADTKNCLKSILKTNYSNFEILLVDNGSYRDETLVLKKLFTDKKISFIRFPKNYGYTGGHNRAIKFTQGKYIIFLNNDVHVEKNWLLSMVKLLEKDTSIAVVQPKILWLKNKKYFDYAGACGGFIDILGYPFTRGRIFNTLEKDKGQYDFIQEIIWASGAAMMVRKNVLRSVGLFDERFFNYMEEIDLCYRIRKEGFKIYCEPKSVIYHKVASTASRNDRKKRFWEHRNNILFIAKNFSFFHLSLIFFPRLLLEYISLLYYIKIKRLDFAFAVIQSQIALLWMLPIIFIKRFSDQKQKITSQQSLHKQSIVYQYFVLKKRNFSEIYYPLFSTNQKKSYSKTIKSTKNVHQQLAFSKTFLK